MYLIFSHSLPNIKYFIFDVVHLIDEKGLGDFFQGHHGELYLVLIVQFITFMDFEIGVHCVTHLK